MLEVTTSTGGSDVDSDGYTLTVDGSDHSIGTDETVTVEDLEEGNYDAELSGLADNCSVDGDNPQQVDITAENTTTASFDITCEAMLKNQIVFLSGRNSAADLYVTNPDGTGQERITNNAQVEYYPSISPDGTKIAYTDQSNGNIYVIDADGSDRTQLTSSGSDVLPRWSPDGSQIVFTSGRDGDDEVYIMNADGSDQTNLTNSPSSDDQIGTWSPNGDRIAFQSDRDADGDVEVYSINTEGTALKKLTDNTAWDGVPIYSPDGSQIAFTSERDGNSELYIMNADGSSLQRVTNNSASDNLSSWSPDGSKLAFQSDRDGNSEVYIINTDGTGATNLTVNSAEDLYPFWSPVK
jgi:Tol biopolymer transport system component